MTHGTQETTITAEPGARDIVVSRIFDAPRELVWKAWTEADRVGQWWGPNGFTTTTYEMDVRPGGRWRYLMHGPDGTDYPNLIEYREVSPPERLVCDHGDDDGGPPAFYVTITFADKGGKTEVTQRMQFPSVEARDRTIEHVGALEGAKQHLGKLADYLATIS